MIGRLVGLWFSDRDFRDYLSCLFKYPPQVWNRNSGTRKGKPAYLAGIHNGVHVTSPVLRLPLLWKGGSVEASRVVDIKLAGMTLRSARLEALPWDVTFVDLENRAALHRFTWLLPLLEDWAWNRIDMQSAWMIVNASIQDWINHHLTPAADEAWQPYTISERLVNWIITCLACGQQPVACESLAMALIKQSEYLQDHLEYFGDELTGNHLSNNGRALYIVGLVLNQPALAQVGRQILLEERKRLFVEPCFLREGSSHYQFLIMRNYCEVLWFARECGDENTAVELGTTVANLSEGCRFFLVANANSGWEIPLIGDISPDCSPEWLYGVPWVAAALTDSPAPEGSIPSRGWHRFFLAPSYVSVERLTDSEDVIARREWVKVKQHNWTIFAHLNPAGVPLPPGHTHQDTGSLVAYYRGEALLVDTGRYHYIDDREGNRGINCWSHTMAVIDELNPAPFYRKIYPKSFLQTRVGALPTFAVSPNALEIRHGGYARRKGIGAYRRQVNIISRNELEIVDEFRGAGFHEIYLIFHTSWQVSQEGLGFKLVLGDQEAELLVPESLAKQQVWRGPSPDKRFGWGSRCYGQAYDLSSIVVSGHVQLPWFGLSRIMMRKG
ncbi:MAG: hypothetical protein C0406_10680 [Sideroxydans sp.]|nr:hypothetical protein [Sideroxydans sp.]